MFLRNEPRHASWSRERLRDLGVNESSTERRQSVYKRHLGERGDTEDGMIERRQSPAVWTTWPLPPLTAVLRRWTEGDGSTDGETGLHELEPRAASATDEWTIEHQYITSRTTFVII